MNRIAVTGGVGMDMGLASLGYLGLRHHVADLDLVATSIDAVSAGVTGRFLVSHYHVTQAGVPKFMVELVDPESRMRVDVFPDLLGSIADARTIHVGQHSMPVLPLNRIFDHKIQTLVRASAAAPIDPKHVQDARFLGDISVESRPGHRS